MLVFDLLNWWYSSGFLRLFGVLKTWLRDAEDFFSIRLLIQNFFSPFRQISAQGTGSFSLSDKARAFFDRLLSCIVGVMVRIFVLIVGVLVIITQILFGVIMVIVWPLIPLSVVCGVVLFCGGVVFNG